MQVLLTAKGAKYKRKELKDPTPLELLKKFSVNSLCPLCVLCVSF